MFTLVAQSGGARSGVLKTAHGKVLTPFFMPVATFGSGRGIGPQDYHKNKVQTIIANAFLLSTRPGVPTIKEMGGLHKFMGFKGSIFTDSGGFQSSRDSLFLGITKKGVNLKNPFDGTRIRMTPEKLVEIQEGIGSDVAMVIDDMAPPGTAKEDVLKALDNTHRWARECKELHNSKKQGLFAIVQGGYDAALRQRSAEYLSSLDFSGYGIGGCAIGEPKPAMYRAIRNSTPFLPEDKPRYLMGVGSPADIVMAVSLGVDCFDSIFPTRNARHRMIFTRNGPYQLEKGRHALVTGPLEDGCSCWVCKNHSRAYLRHLTVINEAEGMRLRQVHNVHFMMRLMSDIRESILQNTFSKFKEEFLFKWFKGKIPKIYK